LNEEKIVHRQKLLSIILALLVATSVGVDSSLAESPTIPIEVVVLGSGGPGAVGRAASCYLILIDGNPRILVDAGPGSFARLGEANVSLIGTDIILLTHLHADHVGELPGLIKARAVSGGDPVIFKVWGPAGAGQFPSTTRILDLLFGRTGAFAYLSDFATPVSFQPHDIDINVRSNQTPQEIFNDHGLVIRSIAGHHGDVPAVIYRIDYAGRSITFSGDIDAQGLARLRAIAKGSDLLVFNSVVLDPPGSPGILYTLHTPPQSIGELARDAGVRSLLLSHISPAVEENQVGVLKSISRNYQGHVSFAADRTRVKP
jgi:ribonuclease BN (tRNA processing enzyme)